VVLEFVTDPQVPPLPPHVRAKMLKMTGKALLKGDEDAVGIAKKGFKGKLAEVAEHAKDILPGEHG
jgi:pyruvate dehydrogenase (quinone)